MSCRICKTTHTSSKSRQGLSSFQADLHLVYLACSRASMFHYWKQDPEHKDKFLNGYYYPKCNVCADAFMKEWFEFKLDGPFMKSFAKLTTFQEAENLLVLYFDKCTHT